MLNHKEDKIEDLKPNTCIYHTLVYWGDELIQKINSLSCPTIDFIVVQDKRNVMTPRVYYGESGEVVIRVGSVSTIETYCTYTT